MARNRYFMLAFLWKNWRMRVERHPVQPLRRHFQRLSCKWRDTELFMQPVLSLMNSECQTRWTLIMSVIGASLEASRAKMKFQSYSILRETDKKQSVWAKLLGLCRKLKADLFFPPFSDRSSSRSKFSVFLYLPWTVETLLMLVYRMIHISGNGSDIYTAKFQLGRYNTVYLISYLKALQYRDHRE